MAKYFLFYNWSEYRKIIGIIHKLDTLNLKKCMN